MYHDPNLPDLTKTQIHAVADAVQRYRDFAEAKREAWKKFGGDEPLMGEHWYRPGDPGYSGGDPIDFTRPSNLMYTDIGGQKILTGVAFTVRLAPGEPLSEGFYGSADRWHVHDFAKAAGAATKNRPLLRWLGNWWLDTHWHGRSRLAMVHVWITLPNPDGIFAGYNRTIPYLKLGLPASFADGASLEAARGLSLASDGACAALIEGRLWIANAPRSASHALTAACEKEGAAIKAVLGASSRDINAAAETSWKRFEQAWNSELTAEQRERIAAMSEHGASGLSGSGHGHEHH